jgi:hypothetical protein
MTDETINFNFRDWNKRFNHPIDSITSTEPTTQHEPTTEWERLLIVANSELIISKSCEILENHRKKKPQMSNQDYVLRYKIAYIVWNLSCIAKSYNIPWVYIFEDVNKIAEVFHNKLDYSIRFEQQMMTILILYFRNQNFHEKNQHLRTILFKLGHSMSADDRQEVRESLLKFA